MAAGGRALRTRATDLLPLGSTARQPPSGVVVQSLGNWLEACGSRGRDAVRLALVRLAGIGRMVAPVSAGRPARRIPASARDVATRRAPAASSPGRACGM